MWSIGTSPDPDSLKIMISSKFLDADKVNHSTIYQDWSGIRDQIIDRNMDQAAATFNHATRAKLYRQVQERLSRTAYWSQIYYRPAIVTADRRVTGVTSPPFFGNDTWNTYTWHTVQ
jgi:ABC-type transport system substrate-binding protein